MASNFGLAAILLLAAFGIGYLGPVFIGILGVIFLFEGIESALGLRR